MVVVAGTAVSLQEGSTGGRGVRVPRDEVAELAVVETRRAMQQGVGADSGDVGGGG